MNQKRQIGNKVLKMYGALFLVLSPAIAYDSVYYVKPNERSFLYDKIRGKDAPDAFIVYGPGVQFKRPIGQTAIITDVTTKDHKFTILNVATKDLELMDVTVVVNSRPIENEVPAMYYYLGTRDDKEYYLISQFLEQIVKSWVANELADDILLRT